MIKKKPGNPNVVEGYTFHGAHCKKCKTKVTYDEKYDVYYCDKCNRWLEEKCYSPKCEFCRKRPKFPKEIK
jgi:hypothetical protein